MRGDVAGAAYAHVQGSRMYDDHGGRRNPVRLEKQPFPGETTRDRRVCYDHCMYVPLHSSRSRSVAWWVAMASSSVLTVVPDVWCRRFTTRKSHCPPAHRVDNEDSPAADRRFVRDFFDTRKTGYVTHSTTYRAACTPFDHNLICFFCIIHICV